MTDVFTLLTLPVSSKNAFATYRGSGAVKDRSDSPPRKTPRLNTDSDSASASRSRQPSAGSTENRENTGPLSLSLIGAPIQPHHEHYYDQDSALVKRSIRVLLSRNNKDTLPATYDKIYNACRAVICVAKKGDGISQSFKLELERCIGELAQELVSEGKSEVEYILPIIEVCAWFEKQTLLESLLAYFDRKYLLDRSSSSGLRQICYEQFSLRVLEDATIQGWVRKSIEEWVTWERQNNSEHPLRPHIPQLISRLSHHGKYETIFEDTYLTCTENFYLAESEEKAKELAPIDFLNYTLQRIKDEIQRSKDVLPHSIWHKVEDMVMRSLLMGRLEWIVNSVLPQFMKTMDVGRLQALYELFVNVDGQQVVLAGFRSYVLETVKRIVTDVERDEEMVDRFLKLKAFTDTLLTETFAESEPIPLMGPLSSINTSVNRAGSSNEPMDVDALPPPKKVNRKWNDTIRDAFSASFKARRNKPAEMIAKYLDKEMRKGQKGKADSVFEKELDAVLELSRFTEDRDVFRTFYHRQLARRLLLQKSASDDFEKAMLKKLKEQYDPEFSMGDHMFNDLSLSRDTMREYLAHIGKTTNQQLNAMVLQSSFWPFSAKKSEAFLPPDMQNELSKFTAFYKSKHQGHKLDWEHSLGTATLKGQFKNEAKELQVSLYQALVLLLFNEETELTFADIKERTRIEDGELRRTLQSLSLGKKRVLKKQPTGKDVKDDDSFIFNADFTDPAYRIHINSIQVKETPEESKKTQSLIETDRKHVLDAAIVRVMKAKKELHNEQLKTGIIDAVKSHFVPSVQLIKERIDAMVEEEYIKRRHDDNNVFIYLA
ncbi:unnamed protein product [Somion occarium]|uniref:Cullin family profile domain-containing protein n=1 Tax=Somion occarium TaxID=3059160 RepID=A0ABP1CPY7_9APHY